VPAVLSAPAQRREVAQGAVDALAWFAAVPVATLLRYEFVTADVTARGVLAIALFAASAQVVSGYVVGVYIGRWRYGSFDEVAALTQSVVVATVLTLLVDWASGVPRWVPFGAVVGSGVIALVLMAGVRYAVRLVRERRRRPVDTTERLLVFGAGDGGVQVITSLLRDPASVYLPVGLLDDDPAKRQLRICGVPVLGDRTRLEHVAERVEATTLLIAVPSADSAVIAGLTESAEAAGLAVKVLPPVSELVGGLVTGHDIRDVSEADLLGRHQVETDVDSVAAYLTGRRVLVTGAGGSIGSELCRQIHRFSPAELVMLDRDETMLHDVQLSIDGRALLDSPDVVLADIRDAEAIDRVFARHRPDVVFHAAALKHLPMLERHPDESLKSNVLGTLNVLRAAQRYGVERFVNISTDKAANPSSVLGYTKRVAERLTAYVAAETGGDFLSVRFGNVLGSRGSVLPTFRAQVEAGGPITVTDKDVTRYFMTVEEAVQLVVQAGAIGRPGEALVLDMGEPVRINDVARRLAARATRPVKIAYTGLRPGEKLHEELLGTGELDRRPIHPLVSHVDVPPLDPERVLAVDLAAPADELVGRLAALAAVDIDRARR
jgi:FlaA1/EpsC-like NDP-sugar epimerase